MELYLLFQTDFHQSYNTRVCFGVFESRELAEDAAIVGKLRKQDRSNYVIVQSILNDFDEV